MATRQQAREAKLRVRDLLTGRPGFSGVGLVDDDGEFHLRVNISTADEADEVPEDVDGVTIDIEVVGEIEPHAT